MGEDHQLACAADFFEEPGQAVDPGRIHGLDRVVQHEEPKRALGQHSPREEQAQGQGVQLALAHDAEGGATHSIHGDVQLDAASGAGSLEFGPGQFHI
jgi:hypothetical protein